MKIFVPMPDDFSDIEALRQMAFVPYRCGMPLLPESTLAAEQAPTTKPNPPGEVPGDLSAAA